MFSIPLCLIFSHCVIIFCLEFIIFGHCQLLKIQSSPMSSSKSSFSNITTFYIFLTFSIIYIIFGDLPLWIVKLVGPAWCTFRMQWRQYYKTLSLTHKTPIYFLFCAFGSTKLPCKKTYMSPCHTEPRGDCISESMMVWSSCCLDIFASDEIWSQALQDSGHLFPPQGKY